MPETATPAEDGYTAVRDVIHKWPGDAERNAVIWHAIQAYECTVTPDVGQLQVELKRERMLSRMAQQHAMRCDADQAAAEAAQARAEARYAGLNAHHLRAVADHRADLDAMTERAERAEAAIEQVEALTERWGQGLWAERYAARELRAALHGAHSPADAPSPVAAATEAHGETTEAQEAGE
jgi:hypothetical protein